MIVISIIYIMIYVCQYARNLMIFVNVFLVNKLYNYIGDDNDSAYASNLKVLPLLSLR